MMGRVADAVVHFLSGHPRPLFGPPTVAEVLIVVGADGIGRVFYPPALDSDSERLSVVAAAIVRAGMWLAESHGLVLERTEAA
jgi:hypothetical protein